jgi:hypothetical protein
MYAACRLRLLGGTMGRCELRVPSTFLHNTKDTLAIPCSFPHASPEVSVLALPLL